MTMTTTATSTSSTSTMIDPDGLNNTLVAESDFVAARQALFNFAAERRNKKNRSNHSSSSSSDDNETLSRTHAVVAQSLLDHLQAAVRPVTDECFHMYCYELQKAHGQEEEEEAEFGNDETTKENEAKDSAAAAAGEKADKGDTVDDHDEDNTDDWEDWVNQPLLERVRNLRQQVRDQAVRVGQVRDEVLQQAVTLARRRCCDNNAAANNGNSMSTALDDDSSLTMMQNSSSSSSTSMAASEQKVLEMQSAMQEMKQTLTLVETRLSESVRQWQETLDTIENEAAPHSSSQSSQQHALSQTEQAIMEREDEDDDNEDDDMDADHDNNNTINNHQRPPTAEERLSRFLSNNMLA
jgi:hypothetical protein